jgi:hypothetical protein
MNIKFYPIPFSPSFFLLSFPFFLEFISSTVAGYSNKINNNTEKEKYFNNDGSENFNNKEEYRSDINSYFSYY